MLLTSKGGRHLFFCRKTIQLFIDFMSFLWQKYLKSDTNMAVSGVLKLTYDDAHEKMEYSKSHTFNELTQLSSEAKV